MLFFFFMVDKVLVARLTSLALYREDFHKYIQGEEICLQKRVTWAQGLYVHILSLSLIHIWLPRIRF